MTRPVDFNTLQGRLAEEWQAAVLYDIASMDTQALLDYWMETNQQIVDYSTLLWDIEMEVCQRMEADGATAIPHDILDVKLTTPSPAYDLGKLRGLAELVPVEEFAKGFTEAHEETVQVPAKFNMVKVKTWIKYGDVIAQVIKAAMIPGDTRLSIKRKVKI